MLISIAVWGFIVPATTAAVAMLLALRPRSASAGHRAGPGEGALQRAPWAAGVAISAAYVLGHAGLPGAPWTDSVDAGRMIPAFAVLGGLAGAALTVFRLPAVVGWAIRLVLGGVYGWLLVAPRVASGLEQSSALLFVGAMVAAVGLTWWSIGLAASSEPGPALALSVLLWGGAGSATLVMSGTALVGQLSGILLAALGGVLVVVWKWPAPGRLASAAGVLALTLVGQWAYALLYASMTWPVFVALVVPGMLLLVCRLPQLRDRSSTTRLFVRIVALGVALALPAALAAKAYFGGPTTGSGTGTVQRTGGPTTADDDYGY